MVTLLIADDEPHIVELVRATLEDERLRILDASDGETALALAMEERPQVILLDVHMPRLDGLEACRRLREDRAFDGTPIIMLTAAAQAADREQGRAVGADHYLTKPFSPIQLLSIVQSLLPGVVAWHFR